MQIKKRTITVGGAAVILLALMLILASNYFGSKSMPATDNTPTTPSKVSSNPNCTASNQTLCGETAALTRYVKLNDYSDILQNQTPVAVKCNNTTALQGYCQGVSSLTIDLYKVELNNQTTYKTRNQYITFFNAYASQYGPFSVHQSSQTGNAAVIAFQNSINHHTLRLTLTNSTSGWKVASLSTGS